MLPRADEDLHLEETLGKKKILFYLKNYLLVDTARVVFFSSFLFFSFFFFNRKKQVVTESHGVTVVPLRKHNCCKKSFLPECRNTFTINRRLTT